jgi:hypothetical protein
VKRLANGYLVGAVSSAATIIVAVVAFVILVSLQAMYQWPVSGLGLRVGNGESSAGNTGAVTSRAKLAAPRMKATPTGSASVAEGGTTSPAVTGARSSKRRHAPETGGGTYGTAAISPAKTIVVTTGSQPPSSADSAPPADSTGTGSGSGSAGYGGSPNRGGGGHWTAASPPASTNEVGGSPDSHSPSGEDSHSPSGEDSAPPGDSTGAGSGSGSAGYGGRPDRGGGGHGAY